MTLEARSRYALSTVLAFVGSSLLLILFSLKAQALPAISQSGLVWIVILFASLASLGRSFVQETERQTFDFLRLNASPQAVFLGKFLYNFLFTLLVSVVTMAAYLFFLNITVQNPLLLALSLLLGTAGLSGTSTMMAALVSQAAHKGAIFPVLSLPLLIPLDLLLVRTTQGAFAGGQLPGVWNDIMALVGFSGVTITVAILLFDYIWED